MEQFSTVIFNVILNFTPENTDFSDVSSFSYYLEILKTGIRFSSPPPMKTPVFRAFFIVSRETFWINRGTMSENNRFRDFDINLYHNIAIESPASYQQVKHKLTKWLIYQTN